jgi:hypothetical protein
MRVERIEGTLVLRAGRGEWYNQRVWDMCEDVNLPPARWHAEVDDAIHAQEARPSTVVIDATDMVFLAGQDIGFLYGLSKRLRAAGSKVTVIARSNEVDAYNRFIRPSMQESFDMVATLDEALRR